MARMIDVLLIENLETSDPAVCFGE